MSSLLLHRLLPRFLFRIRSALFNLQGKCVFFRDSRIPLPASLSIYLSVYLFLFPSLGRRPVSVSWLFHSSYSFPALSSFMCTNRSHLFSHLLFMHPPPAWGLACASYLWSQTKRTSTKLVVRKVSISGRITKYISNSLVFQVRIFRLLTSNICI